MSFPPVFENSTWARRGTSAMVMFLSILAAVVLSPTVASAAGTPLNVSGSWSSIYHCEVGWCAGQQFPATSVFTQATGSDVVMNGTNQGTLVGNVLTLHESSGGYSWTSVLTFAANGKTYSGTLTDSNNTSGIDTGTLSDVAASTSSLNGTWHCCGAGGANPQDFVINGSTGTGDVNGVEFATITDTLVGNQATIVTTYTNSSYVATFTGTLSGTTLSGAWSSNANQTGTFTATLSSALAVTPPTVESSSTQVLPLAATISTPREIFHSMSHNLINAAITVGVIIFITFPANIFNRTFSANYEEILLILAGWRRRVRRLFGLSDAAEHHELASQMPVGDVTPQETPGRVGISRFALVLLLGAVLGGLLNPHFGTNRTSGEGIVATLVSFGIGAILSWYVAKIFRQHHHYATSSYLQALPLGLVIAVVCVLVSRLSNFEPGYLYGVVVGISFAGSLKDTHNAHLTAISVGSTMVVALAAWFVWLPVNHLALSHGTNALIVVPDDVLGSIFVGGLVGSVISLIPIDLLPGKVIATWHRGVWALIFFVATFLLIEVELRPASGPTHPGRAPLITVIVLFLLFGAVTFWMRWYFARRAHLKVAAASAAPLAEVD